MSDQPSSGRSGPSASELQPALARLLRPLVRLMIRSGITFPALSDTLREVYVSVAEKEFALRAKPQTDSRVSLLTGVHRKEVRRLREAGVPVSETPAMVSRSSLILAHWLGSPDFTDTAGEPRPLHRFSDGPDGPGFDSLVAAVTRDVRPRAVLDELLEQEIVSLDDEGRVHLLATALVPSRDMDALSYYFGRNLHDHLAAAVENLAGRTPAFLERAVHYEGLSEATTVALEAKSRELALAALQAANREALAARAEEPSGEGSVRDWRWTFGLYIFRERTQPKP
ncbi:MAG TPA: DUF6502 family protein [Beijerinckiaceae bacterium]|nr:DUF6502 family protein [Beijerinckiaceae bacterium]